MQIKGDFVSCFLSMCLLYAHFCGQYTYYSRTIHALFTHYTRTINAQFSMFSCEIRWVFVVDFASINYFLYLCK